MKTGGRIDRELFYHLFYVTKERKKNMYQAANDRYEKMAYVRCGKSGLKLPAISLGLWCQEDSNKSQHALIKNQQNSTVLFVKTTKTQVSFLYIRKKGSFSPAIQKHTSYNFCK